MDTTFLFSAAVHFEFPLSDADRTTLINDINLWLQEHLVDEQELTPRYNRAIETEASRSS